MNPALQDRELKNKVEDLLSRMTLDQKIGQMTQCERMECTPDEVKSYHLGSVLSGGGSAPGDNRPADWVDMNDAYWAASMEEDKDHLPIPIIYGVDAIHGNNNVLGATIFPHNIGLGAAKDPGLLKRIAQITAKEILATGVDWSFAPTLAVARDNHWGRTYESYAEDPEIVSSYAGKFVQGLQGDLGVDSVAGCVKHWVGDGGTTNGIDQGEATLSRTELERIHISPYYPALDAGVLTVMVSFNSWNGDKCHGHKTLITEVLKNQLQFDGFVISDWDGIDYLNNDYFQAVGQGVNAGIDMFMVPENWKTFIAYLRNHVELGSVSIDRINDAVRRILLVKFACGLFDKPRPAERKWSMHQSFGSADHRSVAREAVQKSLVLLKNQANLLPLNKTSRILVAGKNADNRGHQCGGFTVAWQGTEGNEFIEGGTSIWEGIKEICPDAVLSVDAALAKSNPQNFDAAIVVIGERPYAEGMGDIRSGDDVIIEAGSQIKGSMKVLEPYGTSLELAALHPEDLSTIRTITARGIPVVVVLISGRTLIINKELEEATAFVAAWLPGSEGQGVADVLFGEKNFQGKLSFTWPTQAQPPINRGDSNYAPLFPYGFGLSYA